MIDYEPVIGLEVHVQLLTHSKLFSAAAAAFGGPANSFVDPHTLGLPGALPVLNRTAVEFALRMGLATGCTIRRQSRFARKHYFYPDLPKGYQISQYDEPLCEDGAVEFIHEDRPHKVRLTRIHMEEDAGKNLHRPGGQLSLVDYNRAGVPLIEVVSAPEIRGAAEAAAYLRAVRQLVRFLGISDGNMEEGSLRCDADVSVRPRGTTALGTRTELKNINSFRHVQKAIEHEIGRQIDILHSGGAIVQETRGWDADRGTSRSQRSKEEAHDYRYFPDPDLPPLHISEEWLEEVRRALPETPLRRRQRYMDQLGLTAYDADLLTSEPDLSAYFEAAVGLAGPQAPKPLANWIGTELLGALNRDGRALAACPFTPAMMAELVRLQTEGTISGRTAKEVFARCYKSGEAPALVVEREGLGAVSDESALEAICRKITTQNPKQATQYRAGQEKLFGFFVGQVLRETGGRARPDLVNALLRKLLAGGPA